MFASSVLMAGFNPRVASEGRVALLLVSSRYDDADGADADGADDADDVDDTLIATQTHTGVITVHSEGQC